jgi:hypothetical protein
VNDIRSLHMKNRLIAAAFLAASLVIAPAVATAQTLAAADAAAFIGDWTLTLDTPQGSFEQNLSVKDLEGKVHAELSNQMQPDAQAIDDISKDGNDLVMKFQGDFQGQAFAAKLILTPDGSDKAVVTFDVMDGQFVMQGSAVKK